MQAMDILRRLVNGGAIPSLDGLVERLLDEAEEDIRRDLDLRRSYDQLYQDYQDLKFQHQDLHAKYQGLFKAEHDRQQEQFRCSYDRMTELRRLVKEQGMIPAIKYIRTVTSWGLKESKDFCDTVVRDESLPVFGR